MKLFAFLHSFQTSSNTRTEMYAGRVASYPLVNHVEYAPRAPLRLENDGTDRRTDGRTVCDRQTPDRYTTLIARRGQRTKVAVC